MAEFSLTSVADGRYQVSGDLTFATVSKLVDKLKGCFTHNPVVIDLSGVEHADSASLALLMEWERAAIASGVELKYTALPDQMRSIAGLSDLSDVLPVDGAALPV